jgi:hypothetical protein
MKKLAIALMIILAFPLVFAAKAPADTFFPMNPGDVYTFSVSNHAGKGYCAVNSPVRTIANGKTYVVLVLFNPSGPHEEISLLRSVGNEVFRYDGDGVETRMFMEGPAGISWNQQRRDGRTVRTTIEAIETVTVPAGRFTGCLKFREEQVRPQQKLYTRTWVKPGFGIVKAASYDCPGCTLTNPQIAELTSHTSGGHVHPPKPDLKPLSR